MGGRSADTGSSGTCRDAPHPRHLPTTREARGGRGEGRQLHQRRKEPGEGLAGAGGRDQQRRAVLAGFVEQRQLMLARRPSAACEPAQELFGQQRGRKKIWFEAIHELRLCRSGRAGRVLKKAGNPSDCRGWLTAWPRPRPDRAPACCPRCGPTAFQAATMQDRPLRSTRAHKPRRGRSAAPRRSRHPHRHGFPR